MSLKIVGYARVSTEDQSRNGLSMEAQQDRMSAFALALGHHLARVESDHGVSGRLPPEKRPGLMAALKAVRSKEVDGLLVWKIDRLGRNAMDVLNLAHEADKNGWHLFSVTDNIDTTNSIGRFVLHIMAALAQMESERIGERVLVGMNQLIRHKRVRGSNCPFGFRMPDGHWKPKKREEGMPSDKRPMIPWKPEQDMVARIVELRDEGHGCLVISKKLNEEGLINPRTLQPWRRRSVESILDTVQKYQQVMSAKPHQGKTNA